MEISARREVSFVPLDTRPGVKKEKCLCSAQATQKAVLAGDDPFKSNFTAVTHCCGNEVCMIKAVETVINHQHSTVH